MTDAGPLLCVLVGEDVAHWRIADRWTWRLIQDEKPWTVDLDPEQVFVWMENTERGGRYFKHRDIESFSEGKMGRRLRLHFRRTLRDLDSLDTKGVQAFARFVRNLAWAEFQAPKPRFVYLAMDVDRKRARVDGLARAVDARDWTVEPIGVLPDPESEAWYVAGFVPEDAPERARLDAVFARLAFDPSVHADRLTSTTSGPRDAKRVLAELTAGDEERKARCLDTDFGHLCRAGDSTGIGEFVDAVRRHVVAALR